MTETWIAGVADFVKQLLFAVLIFD